MAEREQMSILNDGSAIYHNKDRSLLGPGPHGIEPIPNKSTTVAVTGQNPLLSNGSSTPVIKTVHTVTTESVPILQKCDIKIESGNGSDASHYEKQTRDLRERVESLQIDDTNPPPIGVWRKRGIDRETGEVSDSRTVKIKTEDVVYEDKEVIYIPKQKPASSSALSQNVPVRTTGAMENVSIPLGFGAGWLDDTDDPGLGRGVNAAPTVDVDAQYVLPRDMHLGFRGFDFDSSFSSSTAGQSSRRQKPHPERERQKGSSGSVSGPSQ